MFKKSLIIFLASLFLIGSFASLNAYAEGTPSKTIGNKLFDFEHEERITNSTRVVTETVTVLGLETVSVIALCNEDERLIGGGFEQNRGVGTTSMYILANKPVIDDLGEPIGWEARVVNKSSTPDQTLTVYAMCAASYM